MLAVFIFHIDSGMLEGGFLGVDVFFVISGFLITSIILRSVEQGRFTLGGFWIRRIKRLYPALFANLFFVVIAGNYVLMNPERSDLFGQSIAAVFSFSNIFLYLTTGNYWSNSSESIALLHTWSLSLEEQFYIVFPLLVLLLYKLSRKAILPFFIVLAFVSFGVSIYQTPLDQSAAFYLLPARMWELLVGSVVAMVGPATLVRILGSRLASLASLGGLCLIVASFCVISYNDYFPGYRAAIPCLGAALVLAFGTADPVGKAILGIAPVNYIGRISYSLYLWHWPIIVFSRFLSPDPNVVWVVLLTFASAALSYHFVETPFRTGTRRHLVVVGVAPLFLAGFALPLALKTSSPGVPDHLREFEDHYVIDTEFEIDATESILESGEGVGSHTHEGEVDILIVGDSHAEALVRAIYQYAEENALSLENLAVPGVSITDDGPKPNRSYAGELNEMRLQRLSSIKARVGILAEAWVWDVGRENFDVVLSNYIKLLSQNCDEVHVLSQVPMVDLPKTHEKALNKYALALSRSGQDLSFEGSSHISEINETVRGRVEKLGLPNVGFIDIYPYLKTEEGGVLVVHDEGVLYSDYYHVNDRGAERLLNELLESRFEAALSE